MSPSWTQVRRLPVRRVFSANHFNNPRVRKGARLGLSAVAGALVIMGAHRHSIARADRLPHEGDLVPTSNRVSDLFDGLTRCQAPLSKSERWRLAGTIYEESRRHGYDPLFVLAMIQVESSCSPTARGEQGAVGLVQIKPSTARAVAKDAGLPWHGPEALMRPGLNVQLALLYLAQLEEQFGDPYLAMVAFNKGPARVGRMTSQRARGARYVKKIMQRYEDLTDAAAEAAERTL